METRMGRLFKILAIDGGGIRGVIPATLLMEIERRTGKRIGELFDLIAGTSTGGILAVGLAKPGRDGQPQYTAHDLRNLYFREGETIFPRSIWSRAKSPVAEKYPASGIEGVLKRYFGDSRLKDAATGLLVTSYEMRLRQPWFFRSQRARHDPDYDFALWEVARATSAAPTYFPPQRIARNGQPSVWELIDGGTYANNPAMCAYAEARQADPDCEVLLVSLATGRHVEPIHYRPGLLGWARPILDVVFDGVSRATEYQLQHLLPPVDGEQRYYRFQSELTLAADAMDNPDPSNLSLLQNQAEQLVRNQEAELARVCAQLVG
jgi:predicted acylesterase/phospholipase RssA